MTMKKCINKNVVEKKSQPLYRKTNNSIQNIQFDRKINKFTEKLPCCGAPFCARIRVQCSDIFIITNGCSETVTDGTVDVLAITLSIGPVSVFDLLGPGFDVEGVAFAG